QNSRGPADQLRDATVRSGAGGGPPIALGLLGRVSAATAPAALRTEGSEVSAALDLDLEEATDLAGHVDRARAAVDDALRTGALRLAPGQRIEWGGQFALLEAGEKRIRAVAALAALAMCALLYLQFRSLAESLLVLVSVPFALVGSVWTLFL